MHNQTSRRISCLRPLAGRLRPAGQLGLVLALLTVSSGSVVAQSSPTYEPYTFNTLAGAADPGTANGNGINARFNQPSGIAVNAAGDVIVADRANHTIRKVTPAGDVTTIAGLAGTPGLADGTGGTARFNAPAAVALDSAGNIYVADSGNHNIRMITPVGAVTTFAGPTPPGPAPFARVRRWTAANRQI